MVKMRTRSSGKSVSEKRTTRLQQTSAIASKRPAKKTPVKKEVSKPNDENDICGTSYQLRKRKSDVSPNASVGQCPPKPKKTHNETISPPDTKSGPRQSKIPDLFAKQKSTRVLRERTNQPDVKNAKVSFTGLKPNLPSDETEKPATKKLPPWKCLSQEENHPTQTEDVYDFVPDANEPKVVKKKRKYVRKKVTKKPNHHKQDEPYQTSTAVVEPSNRVTRNNSEKPVVLNLEEEVVLGEEPVPTVPERADIPGTPTPQYDLVLSGSFLQKSLRLDLERLNLNDAREASRLETSFLKLPQDEGLRLSTQKCRLSSASLSVREQTYSELLDFELSMSPAPLDPAQNWNNSVEADRSTSTPRSRKTPSISQDLPASPIAFLTAESVEESRDMETCDESKENQPSELSEKDLVDNCFGFDSSSPDENASRKHTPMKKRVAALGKSADEQPKPFRLPLQPVLETLRANMAKPQYLGSNKSVSKENMQHDQSVDSVPDFEANRVGKASPEPKFRQPPRRSYEGRLCRRQLLRFSDTESESEDEEAQAKKKAAAKKRTKQSSKTKRKKSKYDKELEEWASRMNSHFKEIENVQL